MAWPGGCQAARNVEHRARDGRVRNKYKDKPVGDEEEYQQRAIAPIKVALNPPPRFFFSEAKKKRGWLPTPAFGLLALLRY